MRKQNTTTTTAITITMPKNVQDAIASIDKFNTEHVLFGNAFFAVPYVVQYATTKNNALLSRIESKTADFLKDCELNGYNPDSTPTEYGILLSSSKIVPLINEYLKNADAINLLKSFANDNKIDLQADLPSIYHCAVFGKWYGKELRINVGNLKVALEKHYGYVCQLSETGTCESKDFYVGFRKTIDDIYTNLEIDGVRPNKETLCYVLTALKETLKVNGKTLKVSDKGVKSLKEEKLMALVCKLIVKDYNAKRVNNK